MSCGGGGVEVSNMTPKVKTGFVRRYRKGFFSSGWKTEFLVLHQDSMLAWYSEQGASKAKGKVLLKHVCNFLAVGPYTKSIPGRPELPPGGNERQMLAIPSIASRSADPIYFFLFADDTELNGWMTKICGTLPPAPTPTQQPQQRPQQPTGGPPPAYQPPAQGHNGPPPPYPPTQNYGQAQQSAPYPRQRGQVQQGGGGAGNTTVIVQDRGGRDSGGDFATGMLLGGAMGMGMGYRPWGWGYGFGGGWGYGGWGHYNYGPDMHVHNHYDVDNTTINNTNIDQSNVENNETNVENNEHNYGDGSGWNDDTQQQGQEGYDQGGYDQGGYDQGGYDQGGYDQGGYDQGGYDGGYEGGYDGGYDAGGYDDGGFDGGDAGGCGDGGGCGGGCGGD